MNATIDDGSKRLQETVGRDEILEKGVDQVSRPLSLQLSLRHCQLLFVLLIKVVLIMMVIVILMRITLVMIDGWFYLSVSLVPLSQSLPSLR